MNESHRSRKQICIINLLTKSMICLLLVTHLINRHSIYGLLINFFTVLLMGTDPSQNIVRCQFPV